MNEEKILEAINEIFDFMKKHKFCCNRVCNFGDGECIKLQKLFSEIGISYFESESQWKKKKV